jgi:hypothetical protein
MSVLFYSSQKATAVEDLQEFVCSILAEEKSENCGSCEELVRRFKQPGDTPDIAILCAADSEELNAFIAQGDLFANTRLVLILPDRRLVTVGKALSMNPRFINYVDGCVADTKAVLGKMLSRNASRQGTTIAECR